MQHSSTFNLVMGLVLAWGVVFWIVRLTRFAREGEIHLVMNGAGDGLFGQVLRSDNALLFWVIWAANLVLMIGVALAFMYFVVFS